MTTPANRAPKFVVIDRTGFASGAFDSIDGARSESEKCDRNDPDAAPHLVHPLGPALPAKVAVKTPVQVAIDAWHKTQRGYPGNFEDVASAVIAAHEAGREWVRVVRWAVWCPRDRSWWTGETWTEDKSKRALYATRDGAEANRNEDIDRLVKVTTTRRRRAAP